MTSNGEDDMGDPNDDGLEVILAEVRATKETAERVANGESPKEGADEIRVLAGLVHQVTEQVERLAMLVGGGPAKATGHTGPDA
jgi:hypothetical protein